MDGHHDGGGSHVPGTALQGCAAPQRCTSPACTVLFAGELVTIGAFRCRPDDPGFETTGQPDRADLLAFPRSRVHIVHENGEGFVSGGIMVALHNRGGRFRRRAVGPDGDRCDWFAVDRAVLLDGVGERDPWLLDQTGQPFRFSHAPTSSGAFLEQRQLCHDVAAADTVDPLEIEERALRVLQRVLDDAYAVWPARRVRRDEPSEARQAELVDAARAVLADRYRDPLRLGTMAGMLGVAHAQLCRVFRQRTGLTLHEFRERLRHHHALEVLGSADVDLTDLALELGYSSHSHFTASFRKAFGVTPSEIRRRLADGDRRLRALVRGRSASSAA